MKKLTICLFFIALLLTSLESFSQSGLIWQEEFNGTSLDTSKWINLDEADGSDSWFKPANVIVSNGTLKINSVEESYNGRHWTGGHIDAKYHPQYKYCETRCRLNSATANVWPAFWTVGWNTATNSYIWPPEFDIFECYCGPNLAPTQAYHYNGGSKGYYTTINDTEWHTYGVYWKDSTTTPVFFIDGKITLSQTGTVTYPYAALLKLTSSPNAGNRYPGCPLTPFEVDYVRVYNTPPNALSGVIQAESYDNMSGVQKENTTDVGGGQDVGWIDTNDWMAYNVYSTNSGNRAIQFRVASPNTGGVLQLETYGGGTVYGTVNIPNTGGWQNWTTVTMNTSSMPAGTLNLAIKANVGGFNVNWWGNSSIVNSSAVNSSALKSAALAVDPATSSSIFNIYPNPSYNGSVTIHLYADNTSNRYDVFTINGVKVQSGTFTNNVTLKNLKKGIYIVRVNAKTQKLIVQ